MVRARRVALLKRYMGIADCAGSPLSVEGGESRRFVSFPLVELGGEVWVFVSLLEGESDEVWLIFVSSSLIVEGEEGR